MDLHGFLGLSKDKRAGYDIIKITAHVKSDASSDELNDLWQYVQDTSPVLDILKNSVDVSITTKNEEGE